MADISQINLPNDNNNPYDIADTTARNDLADKMDKVNPTGSGKMLFNAASTSTGGTRSVCLSYLGDASGDYSTCLGRECTAEGDYSISAGYNNTSTAGLSIVMGARNNSEYSYSTAIGSDLTVGRNYQTVLGRINEVDASSAVVVGWGSSTTPANIFTLSTGGKGTFAGAVEAEGLGATLKQAVIDAIYPVGSIYMTVTDNTAAKVKARFGGTWVAWGSGRVPVGVDSDDTNFATVEKTGGKPTVTLTAAQSGVPQHTHELSELTLYKSTIGSTKYGFATGNTFSGDIIVGQATGKSTIAAFVSGTAGNNTAKNASSAHTNLQPYITCYMWKRTA